MGRRLLVMLVGIALMIPLFASTAGAQQAEDTLTATVVVLVDLSGRLRATDVAEEIRAAAVMNTVPGIDLWVIGFANEGTLPATVVVCEPGDDLSVCTLSLARRSNAEGNDTDHAAALASAADVLEDSDPDVPRIVLLLTDGEYDPSGSGNPTDQEIAALASALDELRTGNVSIWPLGYGRATKPELDALALAAPGSCKPARGLFVATSQEIPGAVNKIIGLVNCAEAIRGDEIVVLPDTGLVIITYAEDELRDGSVEVRNEARQRDSFDCVYDDLADVWTCEIPVEGLGAGTWQLSPAPREFASAYQQPGTPTDTTTTTVGASTTTTASTFTSTTPAPTTTATVTTTVVAESAPAQDGGAGFPWPIVAAVLVGLGIVGGAVLWTRRT